MLSGDELSALQHYDKAFQTLVAAFVQIGLHQDDGMMDVMRASIHATEQQMKTLKQQVDTELAQALSRSQTVIGQLFCVIGAAVIAVVMVHQSQRDPTSAAGA